MMPVIKINKKTKQLKLGISRLIKFKWQEVKI